MVRIDNIGHGVTEDEQEAPHPLVLETSITNYFSMQQTNANLDHRLKDGSTIRDVYAAFPHEIADSQLANPLCVNLSIVTSDGRIHIIQRGKNVGAHSGGWSPAVSGTGIPATDCPNGIYDPFVTAIREAQQEVFGSYKTTPELVTFFGFARTLGSFFPFLFGEIRVPLTSEELESLQTQSWCKTSNLTSREFNIKEVTNWMIDLYNETDQHGQPTARYHTTIFSLYQSLLYEYPDRHQEIIAMLR